MKFVEVQALACSQILLIGNAKWYGALLAACLIIGWAGSGWTAESDLDFSGSASVNFDSSRHRIQQWEAQASVALEREDAWRLEVGGLLGFGLSRGDDDVHHEPRAFMSLQWTVWQPEDSDIYVDLLLDTDAPSEMSGRGFDLAPALKLEFKAAERWWLGAGSGVALCTAPEEGSRAGYVFGSAWASYDTRWLGNESDTVTFSVYGATHEIPGFGNTLSIELTYGFDLTDSLSFSIGGGSELASPYPHPTLFFAARIGWNL